MSERIYIHETIVISVKHRKDYLDLMTGTWAAISAGRRKQSGGGGGLFGCWATVGSTGPWPEAIRIAETPSAAALSAGLSREFDYLSDPAKGSDDHYQKYWAIAPEGVVDTGGVDRLLSPTASSPSIAEAIERGVKGEGYYHETITTHPGGIRSFLDRYEAGWRPLAESYGLQFVAAFRTLMRNDAEAIVLWALPEWSVWEQIDVINQDPRAARFHAETADLAPDWSGKLLAPAAENPLNIGRML